MKIAVVTYAMNVGGLESVVLSLARGLREKGHDVSFVVTDGIGEWHQRPASEGFQIETVLLSRWESRRHHAKRVAKVLSRYDAALLNHSAPAQCGAGLLPSPMVALAVLHNNVEDIYRVGLANAENLDGIVAVSERVRQEAVTRGIPADRAFCIRNGVEVFSEYPKKGAGADPGALLKVVFLGRIFHEQKGVHYLPGMAALLRKSGVSFVLDIVGDGPDRGALESKLAAQGLSDAVRLHGAVDHETAMQLLAGADALVMPSHFEGQPITLFEAMARGVVPVVSRLAGITDSVIDHGVDGLLAEVGDEEAFAAGLARLAEPSFRVQLSRAAWQRARENYSIEAMTQAYLELISDCLLRRSKNGLARTGKLDPLLLGKRSWVPVVFHDLAKKLG